MSLEERFNEILADYKRLLIRAEVVLARIAERKRKEES